MQGQGIPCPYAVQQHTSYKVETYFMKRKLLSPVLFHFFRIHGDLSPFRLLCKASLLILSNRQVIEFLLEFEIALEPPGVQGTRLKRLPDGTSRLTLMLAVPETAQAGKLLDIGEGILQSVFVTPHLKLSHTGVVDYHPTTR